MPSEQASSRSRRTLISLVLLLSLTTVLSAAAAFAMYRQSQAAHQVAEQASARAVAAQKKEQVSRQSAERNYSLFAEENFKVQYLLHLIGARTLTEPELKVIRPAIAVDEILGPTQTSFDQDVAKIQQVIGEDAEITNYQKAVASLLAKMKP